MLGRVLMGLVGLAGLKIGLLVSLGVLSSQLVHAEALDIPTPPASSVTIPGRGMTMEQVEADFGVPLIKHDTVGKPPITQWEYSGFSVYFESQWVIHAVGKRATPPQPEQQSAVEEVPVEQMEPESPTEPAQQQGDVTIPTQPLTQDHLDTTYPLPE